MGFAAGDALGTTLEFKPPGTFERVAGIVGGGLLGLEPGQWTATPRWRSVWPRA